MGGYFVKEVLSVRTCASLVSESVWCGEHSCTFYSSTCCLAGERGGVVAKALRYKPAGRGFGSMMLRTEPRHVPPEWTIWPDFHIWPPRRKGAILWLMAHMVYYCIQNRKRLIDTDYADFLRRARWKSYQEAHRMQRIGNYLVVFSE